MTELEWKVFLKEFLSVLISEDYDNSDFHKKTHQLLSPKQFAQIEEQILNAEHRLGITFPPSYRSFLKVSNGWPEMGAAEPGRLWSSSEVQWLRDQDLETIEGWSNSESDISPTKHLYYRDVEEDCCWFREAYLQNMLAISCYGDACILLLSPEVLDQNGEWECWSLASWYPGAARYRSFEKWMMSCYGSHVDNLNEENGL